MIVTSAAIIRELHAMTWRIDCDLFHTLDRCGQSCLCHLYRGVSDQSCASLNFIQSMYNGVFDATKVNVLYTHGVILTALLYPYCFATCLLKIIVTYPRDVREKWKAHFATTCVPTRAYIHTHISEI